MPECVAIALSGGIDSLVAAALLKEQGHSVIGLHFITGFESGCRHPGTPADSTCDPAGIEIRARRLLAPMVAPLHIPVHIIDLRREFQSEVIDYFVTTYQQGRTPNPCLVCNPSIKFDILFQEAQALGAERIATGHYARIERDRNNHPHLLRGIDPLKEQSYFLARLSQRQLHRAVLPLGGFTKDQTRRMARQKGLQPAAEQESQDICFIKDGSYGDFLKQQPGFRSAPGIIEDLDGHPIGQHNGLYQFTVGQRRGINCPAAEPYYVIALDAARNVLVVGGKQDLQTRSCRVGQISWIGTPSAASIEVHVRVRYRHVAVPALLTPEDPSSARITFFEPQSAVTPGQGAVLYKGDEVLGGGWIL
jgi:tRNA-uridine 2-sulfurtransferase